MRSTSQILQAAAACRRLDLWLHQQFPEHSRSMLQRLIAGKRVRLRGEFCAVRAPVRAGDRIEIEFPPPAPSALEPEDVALEILFEDEHLLVLNKPAGMLVHPGAGQSTHTLVHALLHHCRNQLSGIGGVERPGIVHRLDKETSGCLVVAKTDAAHRHLSGAFQTRSIEKIYLALVWGTPRASSGRIDRPIGRHPVQRRKMAVLPSGRAARTDWKISRGFPGAALLECRLHTGRTHQIRVHLAAIGHPIIGDPVYGGAHDACLQRLAGRQMLHAWKLCFEHPVRHLKISCEAPLPDDLRRVIAECATGGAGAR